MKHRLLALLLVVALMVTMLVAPASAETAEANITQTTELCPCGCGKTLDALNWRPWDSNAVPPTSGHYYLDGNYVQDAQKEIMAGDRVVLDLRGNTITSKTYGRLLLVYGRFHLLDTVGGGRFMSKTSGGAYGGVVMVSTNEVNDSIFEVCSGTVTRDADNKGSRRGGLVQVSATATFRMTGGMLLNGSTISTANPDTKEPGGCVAAINAASTIEILGGKIVGGESATYGGNIHSVGTTILKNCEIIGGVAAKSGGNIYQSGGSLTIENAIIRDGVSNDTTGGGGNIGLVSASTVSIKDSTVRNGWTAYHGGNIYLGSGTLTLDNAKVEAGVAGNRGNNIYGSSSSNGMTIKNCDLPGDITYIGKGLVLEGKVKIGLLNNGLRMWYKDYYPVMDASKLTEGSEIYVDANHTFTTKDANLDYFKGAIHCVLSQSEEGLVGTQAASGELGGYCPHCGERVAWTAFSLTESLVKDCYNDAVDDTDPACTGRHIESGHYYLGASITKMAQQYIGAFINSTIGTVATEDVVLDLAGYHITASGRSFYLRPQSADKNTDYLTILDSYGGSKVTGSGANTQGGGVLYNEGGNLTIYGGTYVYNPVSGRNIAGGGVAINSGTINLHGGTLDGSAFTYTDKSTSDKKYTYRGGALSSLNGTKYVTITAGRLMGGTAQIGGCVFFGQNNVVNITGGQFSGGVSNLDGGGGGGCLRFYGDSSNKKAVINMSGASVRDGEVTAASAGGGNLSIAYGTFKFDNCYIEGGKVKAYGGNMTLGTSGNITFTDCIIADGYAADRGGNVHVSATSAVNKWVSCLIIGGTAKTYGGSMNVGNGKNTIQGGQILFGTAGSYGGNIVNTAGNYSATSDNFLTLEADSQGSAVLLAGGSAKTYGGNLYSGGVTNLLAATLRNGAAGTSGKDIYVVKASKQGTLNVGAGVTGDISAAFAASLLGSEIYGQPIDQTACTQLNANIVLEGNYNEAILCAKDGKLFVGAIAVTDGNSYKWFTDTASAVAACDENSYVKLFIAQDVVLTKDCAIDLCGQTVNISGAYTLYGMDSSGDGFTAPTGRAVVSDETTVATDVNAGGKRYIATSDAEGYVFHRLENRISNVSLRPAADGIYFTGSFGCDEIVGADIAAYGVAVSVMDMPGKDFMTDQDTLYTNFDASTIQGGAKQTGVLISGILKDDRSAEYNSIYGKTPVYATSYLIMKDGSVVLSDTEGREDDVAYSLCNVMTDIDSKIMDEPLSYRKYTNAMRDFYNKWKDMGMADWGFRKINTPADDGVIDVLMIGSSFCYYYVEEMVGLAQAAGIPMRVCNVYYSGCPLEKHYNWWINGEANYQFFDTTVEKGRKQTNNVSLEWCLAQGEWDVISLQQSTSATRNDPNHLETTRLYYTTLLNYLMEQFPDADMMWHQPWSYQIGYDRSGYQMTSFQQQQEDMEAVQAYCMAICKEFDIQRVNTGEAWQIVRSEYGYDELCARLGKGDNHEGDFYHDGDIGGGQYLNACVWFEIITGVSPVGNTYAPTYKYNGVTYELDSDITYPELQEAAHQAVLDLRAQENAG